MQRTQHLYRWGNLWIFLTVILQILQRNHFFISFNWNMFINKLTYFLKMIHHLWMIIDTNNTTIYMKVTPFIWALVQYWLLGVKLEQGMNRQSQTQRAYKPNSNVNLVKKTASITSQWDPSIPSCGTMIEKCKVPFHY